MAVPQVNIMLEDITRLLIRDIGWVEVVPGSVKVINAIFRKAIPDSEETEYAGWGYFGIQYSVIGSDTISFTTSENIIVLETPQSAEPLEGE